MPLLTRQKLQTILWKWGRFCQKSPDYEWQLTDLDLWQSCEQEIKNINHEVYLKSKPKKMYKQKKLYNLNSQWLRICKFIVDNNLDDDDEYEERIRNERYHQFLNILDNQIQEYENLKVRN